MYNLRINPAKQIGLILFLFLMPLAVFANYQGALQVFIFDRNPGPRYQSMGKTGVAMEGDIYSSLINPATLTGSDNFNFTASKSEHMYLLEDAKLDFYGASFGLNNIYFGASYYLFDHGYTVNINDETNTNSASYDPFTEMYSISTAYALFKNLDIGFNYHLLREEYGNTSRSAGLISMGSKYTSNFLINSHQALRQSIGISVFNPFNNKVKFFSEDDYGSDSEDELPVILRVGLSEKLVQSHSKNPNDFEMYSLTLNLEYQNLLNYRYRNGYKAGIELLMREIVSVRAGYYYETIDDYNNQNNADHLSDFTYGFGINLPFQKFTERNIPLSLKFDYTQQDQPSFSNTELYDFDPITQFSLALNWKF